jgi:hypothetical protein
MGLSPLFLDSFILFDQVDCGKREGGSRVLIYTVLVCICDPGLGQSGGSAYATPISSQQHILVTNNLVAFSPRSPHLLLYIQSRHGCYKKRFVVRTKTVLLLFLPGAPRTPKRPAKLVLTCHRVRSMVVTGETDEPISRWLK